MFAPDERGPLVDGVEEAVGVSPSEPWVDAGFDVADEEVEAEGDGEGHVEAGKTH